MMYEGKSGKSYEHKNWNLADTIAADCRRFEEIMGEENWMYLNKCKDTDQTGIWQLILNGTELWYGTLTEINAIVKSLVKLHDPETSAEYK